MGATIIGVGRDGFIDLNPEAVEIMPSLQLSPPAPDPVRELDRIRESIERLRDYVRMKGLAPTHPDVQEIEDIWWRTKRFIERVDARPGDESDSQPDIYPLFSKP